MNKPAAGAAAAASQSHEESGADGAEPLGQVHQSVPAAGPKGGPDGPVQLLNNTQQPTKHREQRFDSMLPDLVVSFELILLTHTHWGTFLSWLPGNQANETPTCSNVIKVHGCLREKT